MKISAEYQPETGDIVYMFVHCWDGLGREFGSWKSNARSNAKKTLYNGDVTKSAVNYLGSGENGRRIMFYWGNKD